MDRFAFLIPRFVFLTFLSSVSSSASPSFSSYSFFSSSLSTSVFHILSFPVFFSMIIPLILVLLVRLLVTSLCGFLLPILFFILGFFLILLLNLLTTSLGGLVTWRCHIALSLSYPASPDKKILTPGLWISTLWEFARRPPLSFFISRRKFFNEFPSLAAEGLNSYFLSRFPKLFITIVLCLLRLIILLCFSSILLCF